VATFALIHGGGGSAWDWHLVAPELREHGHDPVAVDLPSEDDSAGWSEYADTVVQAVGDRSDLVVVGHSLGGFTAPLVCARIPVELLVLVAAMIPSPGELFAGWWTNAGYEQSGYDDVSITTFPPSSRPRRGEENGRRLRKRCGSPGPLRPGLARRRGTSSAATTACSRPPGRAVMPASASVSSPTKWTAAITSR
jgi:pimeloyl-ACP methyl ester carboxylesterase